MGMFDEVRLKCPACQKEYRAQSKGGECILATYDFPGDGDNEAPLDVMTDINRHAPFSCECGAIFEVKLVTEPRFQVVLCE